MPDEEHHWDLVMPFVTVKSSDGPHDDTSYVCGYEMGRLDSQLEVSEAARIEHVIHTDNLKQADLIAMRRRYSLVVNRQDDEWATVSFVRV